MGKKAKWAISATAAATLAVATAGVLWPNASRHAIGECLRNTTVEMIPLPEGCIQTKEIPPENLMRIIEQQEVFYHLELQKVVVCKTANRLSSDGLDLIKGAFSEETRKRWLPLYVGCCSYQFRRHVTVVAAQADENGSLIAEAALVQSRWDYLRANWAKDRSYWY
jgi:hypothetical protein